MGGSPVWLPARKWSKNGRCAPGARRRRPTVHLLPLHDLLPLRDEKRFIAVHVHSAPKCSGRNASSKHLRCGAVAGHSGTGGREAGDVAFRGRAACRRHTLASAAAAATMLSAAQPRMTVHAFYCLTLASPSWHPGPAEVIPTCSKAAGSGWMAADASDGSDGGRHCRSSHISHRGSPPPSLPALLSLFLRIGKCWFQVGRW